MVSVTRRPQTSKRPKMTADQATRFDRFSQTNYAMALMQLRDSGACKSNCEPYRDVFTYNRWGAQGYQVNRGSHGATLSVFIHTEREDEETGERISNKRPWHTTVFCRCQVSPKNGNSEPTKAQPPQQPPSEPPTTEDNSGDDFWGEPISVYTRAQAIEDGVLVDLMQDKMLDVCRQHYKWPIACTASVFGIMRRAVENKKHYNDYAGILHDMLWMSKVHCRNLSETTKIFRVKITGAGRQSVYDFKMLSGPGDDAEPVLTIMMPEED